MSSIQEWRWGLSLSGMTMQELEEVRRSIVRIQNHQRDKLSPNIFHPNPGKDVHVVKQENQ